MLKLCTIETSAENLTFMQTVHQINKKIFLFRFALAF